MHETEPGVGDPPGFRLDDCATQRNLSETGRAQAVAMGRTLAEQGVAVTRVESSRWCRCVDTARLAFPAQQVVIRRVVELVLRGSFSRDGADPRAACAHCGAWNGPGVLVLVTHQVNISALTGRPTASGEAVVLRPAGGEVRSAGDRSGSERAMRRASCAAASAPAPGTCRYGFPRWPRSAPAVRPR